MTMRHCVASILFLFRHASIEHNVSSSFGRRGLPSSSSEAKTKGGRAQLHNRFPPHPRVSSRAASALYASVAQSSFIVPAKQSALILLFLLCLGPRRRARPSSD